jgi:3-methyladenine DNA glycosylase AlkD
MDPATPDPDRTLIQAIRLQLLAQRNPAKAQGMQAYMKSAMPYHGVQTPALREICRQVFGDHPLGSFAAWRATVLALWREASHREERYVEANRDRLAPLSRREALKNLDGRHTAG